jgi:DNA-directed RNA polymerase specialized sigma24 family protein
MSTVKKVGRGHYVNNKTLLEEMTKYREKVQLSKKEGTPKPPIPNYVGQALMLIANRLSHKPNFSNYSYKEEMISDGIENCIMYIDNFDPEKSKNPFAYFTQIIHYAFIRRIQKEKKQQYIKIKNMENSFIFSELSDHMDGHEADMGLPRSNLFDNEITAEFVKNFENSLEKKKKPEEKVGIEKFIEGPVDNEKQL